MHGPLGGCSLIGLTVIIERALALRRASVIDPAVAAAVEGCTGEASMKTLLAACKRSRGSLARIVEEVLGMRRLGSEQVREAMYAAGHLQVGRLERGLTLLEIAAGVSPLIGLLGTVLGMFAAFNTITSEGIGDAQVLSAGIAQALITTIAGLCIAIPALACHSWFSKRVDMLATEMQSYTIRLIAALGLLGRPITPGSWTEQDE